MVAKDMKELSGFMATGGLLSTLQHLDLSQNYDLEDQGVIYLSEAMVAGGLQHLHELDLSDTCVGDDGTRALLQALTVCHACPRLERLTMTHVPMMRSGKKELRQGLIASRGVGGIEVDICSSNFL